MTSSFRNGFLRDDTTGALVASDPVSSGRLDALEATYRHTYAGADIGPHTSPSPNLIDSGSFVADAPVTEVRVEITASMRDRLAGNAAIALYYGDAALVSPPLLRPTQAALKANTTEVAVGSIDAEPASTSIVFAVPTTIGHTYLWESSDTIVGYANALVLPDNPIGLLDVSPVQTDANRPPGGLEYGDSLIVSRSVGKLHVSKMNHETGRVDQKITGAGVTLTAGSVSGSAAASPDAKRCIVTHYGLGKVSLYDLANPAVPVQVGTPSSGPFDANTNLTTGAAPFSALWTDNDTVWLAGYGTNPGYVQKITGCSGAAPTVQTAVSLTGSGATAIVQLTKTPDGTKLVCADGSAKAWVIDTGTNGVTSAAVPSGLAGLACAISNTKAMVLYGASNIMAELNLTALTWSAGLTSANFTNPWALHAFGDGNSVLLHRSPTFAGASQIRHVLTTQGNRLSAPSEYTSWPIAAGTPAGVAMAINDHGTIVVSVTGVPYSLYIWYGQPFYLRPSAGAFYSEKALVTAKGAH